MNLAEFIKSELARFRAQHPAADGWHVHLCHPPNQTFMPKVPAFLRIALKPADFEEDIVTDAAYCIGRIRERLTYLPRKLRGQGVYEDDWTGDIRLLWRGTRIHLRRIWTPQDNPFISKDITLIATTDLAALESFWREGLRFARRRRRAFIKTITVVNGPDLARPKQRWTDVVLPDGMKAQIRDNFEAFIKARKVYKEMGLPYRRGFLFKGPPGNGKTLVSKIIASEYRVNMVTMHIKSDLDERVVDRAFSLAAHNNPCVLLLEDLDKMVNSTRVSLAYMLNLLDGLNSQEGIIVIATTNNPEQLDPALLHRPSRFDRVWQFGLPALEQRLALLKMRGLARFSEEALDAAARESEGFSMAYVQEAVTSAQLLAINDGTIPDDTHLSLSISQLRAQIKSASHTGRSIGAPAAIGFSTAEA